MGIKARLGLKSPKIRNMSYINLFKEVEERYDQQANQIALLNSYALHGYSQEAIYKYSLYYDFFVEEVIDSIKESMEIENIHMDIENFKMKLYDPYWVYSTPKNTFWLYEDKEYVKTVELDLSKCNWIEKMFQLERKNNKEFKDFVKVFDL